MCDDCFWNCSTPGALSDVIANTSNDTDLVTTSEEEFDYALTPNLNEKKRPQKPRFSKARFLKS